MKITIKECPGNTSYFFAYLDGKKICCSRTPLLTCARIFQRAGVSDDEEILMYTGDRDYWSLRSTVGKAAKWVLQEHPKYGFRWKPYVDRKPPDKASTA